MIKVDSVCRPKSIVPSSYDCTHESNFVTILDQTSKGVHSYVMKDQGQGSSEINLGGKNCIIFFL